MNWERWGEAGMGALGEEEEDLGYWGARRALGRSCHCRGGTQSSHPLGLCLLPQTNGVLGKRFGAGWGQGGAAGCMHSPVRAPRDSPLPPPPPPSSVRPRAPTSSTCTWCPTHTMTWGGSRRWSSTSTEVGVTATAAVGGGGQKDSPRGGAVTSPRPPQQLRGQRWRLQGRCEGGGDSRRGRGGGEGVPRAGDGGCGPTGGGWGQRDKSWPRDGDRALLSAPCPWRGVATPVCLFFLPLGTVLGPFCVPSMSPGPFFGAPKPPGCCHDPVPPMP